MQFLRTLAKHRLREFNHCHEPAGSGAGGQFCDGDIHVDTSEETQRNYSDGPALRVLGILTNTSPKGEQRGTLQLNAPRGYEHQDYAVVGNVNINPAYREGGHASALYDKAVETAKALGYKGVQAGDLNFTSTQYWKRWVETGKAKKVGSVMVREFNPCHMPAGTTKGGQFADKGADGCAGPAHGAIKGEWTKSSRATGSRRATTGPMRPATKAERKRYVIPPSFVDAMVSTDPRSEVRATAVSPVTGKKRAVYSASYNDRQALAKWSRIAGVHRQMDKIVARVEKDSTSATSPDQQAAMALRIILQTGMRNGAENEHDTYGATSLQLRHVHVNGTQVGIVFKGKGGVDQAYTITDPVLAKYVTARKGAAGASTDWLNDMFSENTSPLFDHSDEDTLAYLKKVAGKQYKVHDLRTWYGTVYADQLVTKLIAEGLTPRTPKEAKAFQKQVATKVAAALGNTPAVTIKNYIHPYVWKPIETKPVDR